MLYNLVHPIQVIAYWPRQSASATLKMAAMAAVACLLLWLFGFPAQAGGSTGSSGAQLLPGTTNRLPQTEVSIGGEVRNDAWTLYTTTGFTFGTDIREPGWRVRATSGYGRYRYVGYVHAAPTPKRMDLTARKTFADALVGYQFQLGTLTLRTFGGMAWERHVMDPRDGQTERMRDTYGAKAALEAWWSLGERTWIAGDFSWSGATDTYKAGLNSGYKFNKFLDIGVEAQLECSTLIDWGRGGLFVTGHLIDDRRSSLSMTLSAGLHMAHDFETSPYALISLYYRY